MAANKPMATCFFDCVFFKAKIRIGIKRTIATVMSLDTHRVLKSYEFHVAIFTIVGNTKLKMKTYLVWHFLTN